MMSGFHCCWFLAGVLLHSAAPVPEATARRDIERSLGLLQYIAGDYPAAVSEQGTVLDRGEYAEQLQLLRDVQEALSAAAGSEAAATRDLARALHDAASRREVPSRFVPQVNRLHAEIVRVFAIELAPTTIPSLVTGRILYRQSCAECHAEDGSADTPRARTLSPRPASFVVPEVRHRLSPYHVYNIATFGVPGTAMASFEALDAVERWDLAFYVTSLRHVAAALESEPLDVPELTLRDLARATDADLERLLAEQPPEVRAQQIARWRRALPLRLGD